MSKIRLNINIVLLILYLCFAVHAGTVYLRQFTFDEDTSLKKWRKMVLNGEVSYTLMKYGGEGYVKALSEEACSALYYRLWFSLKDYPSLKWKWSVLQFPDKTMAQTAEDKDDYAARVYVIFPFLSFSSSKFLEYVWAEDIPVGTVIDSPAGDNVKILVVRSGRMKEGVWAAESRNVYEDYKMAFGREPNRKAGAVAIMCDADSTKTIAESLFDEIAIETEKEP